MTELNFTDRASYLAWRADWKANYKLLSAEIRKLKGERTEANRAWSKEDNHATKSRFYNALYALQQAVRDANAQLEELKEGKGKAALAREANLLKEAA